MGRAQLAANFVVFGLDKMSSTEFVFNGVVPLYASTGPSIAPSSLSPSVPVSLSSTLSYNNPAFPLKTPSAPPADLSRRLDQVNVELTLVPTAIGSHRKVQQAP